MLVAMTLNELERRDAQGHFFPEDLRKYANTVLPRTYKQIRQDNTCGERR